MKKILIILFTIFTLTLLFTNKVFCEEGTIYSEGDFQYIINEDNDITIVKYNGKDKEVIVPRSIGTHNVSIIEENTFVGSDVNTLRLPDSILFVYDTNVESMKVIYYDIFDKDIKKEDGKDVVMPEEKREKTIDNQISQESKSSTQISTNNEINIEEIEESTNEESSSKIESSNNNNNSTSEIGETSHNDSSFIFVIPFVVIIVLIVILFVVKKRLIKKTSHN